MPRMYANFSDKAYNDYINGNAVDNNGFRSAKGYYYPDQPTFEPINEISEQFKECAAEILVDAGRAFVFNIVLPAAKRFVYEKLYPFAEEKWDRWLEKYNEKSNHTNINVSGNSIKKGNNNNTHIHTKCQIYKIDDNIETA